MPPMRTARPMPIRSRRRRQRDAKGDYQPIGQAISLGDEPTHASLSADGRYLFVSNYGSRQPRRQPGGAALDEDGRPCRSRRSLRIRPACTRTPHRLTCIRRCPARTARAFWSATWAPTGCSSTATTRAMPSARCGRMSRPASSCPRAAARAIWCSIPMANTPTSPSN